LRSVIDRTYPLARTADAIRYLAEGHAQGKVLIDVISADVPDGDEHPKSTD
jgi:hypothetical protein